MKQHKQELLLNITILLVVSLICAGIIAIKYHDYTTSQENQKMRGSQPFFIVNDSEYSFETVSRQDIKITPFNGSIKLMMDPFTVYRNRPNQKTNTVTIDSHGFRGSFNDTDMRPRIIITGGSVVFGFGLNHDNETFSEVLERKDPQYQVINAGVTGFLSGQELAYYVHYLSDYKPKVIMSFSGWNDITEACAERYAEKKSNTYTYGVNGAFNSIEDQLVLLHTIQGDNNYTYGEYHNPADALSDDEVFREVYQTYVANMIKMDQFAKGSGADFIVVLQPDITTKNIRTQEEKIYFDQIPDIYKFQKRYNEFIQYARKELEKNHIQYIDVTTEPAFIAENGTIFLDSVHLNAKGHAMMADMIDNYLRRQGLITGG